MAATNDREVLTSRLIDAPRDLVWKAWTEPERLAKLEAYVKENLS